MPLRDLKYLLAYLLPLSSFAGLYFLGWASAGSLWFGFVLVPLIELFVPASTYNEKEEVYVQKSRNPVFDYLLYLNVFAVYGLLGYFLWTISMRPLTVGELIFSIINIGVLMAISGINVAHELGHRPDAFDLWMSRLLLLPTLYSHFTLEHNYGHHLRVGTPDDPATAGKNQSVYSFFVQSIIQGYAHAWKIGTARRKEKSLPAWRHEIIWYHLAQLVLISGIVLIFGWGVLIPYLAAALISILTLEAVNYIEHYGLVRKKMSSGRYEPMGEEHSWNSNHEIGRIVLFELVRHPDHHFQSTRKYQSLRHLDKSPQLPFGYPMSIAMALIPPIWFSVMNPKIEALEMR